MSIALRAYQERDVDRIRESYRAGKKAPLYVAPTGSGKTVLFAYICWNAFKRGHKVLIICHRIELVDQISAALKAQGVPHGFIASGYPYASGLPVYVANVFTLVRRLDWFCPDLVITDEAHHVTVATTWGKVLQAYPKARRLGVTATPVRLSGEGLDSFFDDLIVGPSYEELISDGYLTDLEIYAPPTVTTDGLHTRAGDFVPSEVTERVDRPAVTGDAIAHYKRTAPGRRTIVFDISVAAAKRRAEAFRAAGFKAEAIDGNLAPEVRAMAIRGFRSGDTQILVSVDLVSEGFDLPAVEVGISLRPTQSLGLWMQQAGRLLRPMEGKRVALLFDHTGNWTRHGLPTERRDWTLAGIAAPRDGDKPEPGVRVCLNCFSVSRVGARTCKNCGETFPIKERKVKQKDGKLEKLTPEEVARRRQIKLAAFEQSSSKSLESLIALGRMRGMRNPEGWAQHVLQARRAKGRL